MPLRQNLQKHNSPPDTLKYTHTPPHGDTDLRCSEPPTSQKASAPFLLFTRSLTGAPRPNSKGFDAASLYHRNRKVTQLKNSQMQGKCHLLSYTAKEAGVVVILKKKIRLQKSFFEIWLRQVIHKKKKKINSYYFLSLNTVKLISSESVQISSTQRFWKKLTVPDPTACLCGDRLPCLGSWTRRFMRQGNWRLLLSLCFNWLVIYALAKV